VIWSAQVPACAKPVPALRAAQTMSRKDSRLISLLLASSLCRPCSCAAGRNTSVRRTTGSAPDEMMSPSTWPNAETKRNPRNASIPRDCQGPTHVYLDGRAVKPPTGRIQLRWGAPTSGLLIHARELSESSDMRVCPPRTSVDPCLAPSAVVDPVGIFTAD
jgi:hypothetical protein